MRRSSTACWLSFVDWLDAGVSGVLPETLRLTLGPVGVLLPLARRSAEALGPWLLALLRERQRTGRARLSAEELWKAAEVVEQDTLLHPLTRSEAQQMPHWLGWLLEAELVRMARLAEAPPALLSRPDWLTSEVRYWALVVCLARLGQWYALLERRQGREAAARTWANAAERVWQHSGGEPEAA